MSPLSESLLKAVQDSGITKPDLAKRSHISQNYLSTIWKGSRDPDISDVKSICKAIGRDPDDFLDLLSAVKITRPRPIKKSPIFDKTKKASSGTKLQKAEGTCIVPGCFKTATENAHPNCHDQNLFGSGMGQKADNIFTAEVCHEHHMKFHDIRKKKDLATSEEFKTYILLTIKRKIDQGRIIVQ